MTDALPLWIARLAGDQETMGRQHGELVGQADGVDRMLAYYPEMPERVLIGDGRSLGVRALRAAVGAAKEIALTRLERDRPADLRARTRAFMKAAGRPVREARYVGVMDLLQNVVGVAGRLGVGPFADAARAVAQAAAVPACSTVIAWGDGADGGGLRHARNFDFPGIGAWDTAPALLLCKPDRGMRYGFVAARGADAPCVTVFNEAGLTITSHTRFHRKVRFGGAAIIDIVHEIARRAESLEDAARIAAARPSLSTWGLAVSSARERRAISIELHGGLARRVEPAAGAHTLVVTNRYRHPDMLDGEVAASVAWAMHSDARERRLRGLIAAAGGPLTAEMMMTMLADRADADAPDVKRHLGGVVGQGNNVHAVVVDVEARTLLLGVGPAPVCDGPFARVQWDWDGPVGAWEGAAPGITVVPVEIPGLAPSVAARAVSAVIREEQSTRDPNATAAHLDRAIAAAPGDPSLRLAALWTQLRRGDSTRALAHARAGLVRESLPYRRAQLLLWGARAAAAAGDGQTATSMLDELDRVSGADVDDLRAAGRADRALPLRRRPRRPDAHLAMADAR